VGKKPEPDEDETPDEMNDRMQREVAEEAGVDLDDGTD
jgi:hypothetical protein